MLEVSFVIRGNESLLASDHLHFVCINVTFTMNLQIQKCPFEALFITDDNSQFQTPGTIDSIANLRHRPGMRKAAWWFRP